MLLALAPTLVPFTQQEVTVIVVVVVLVGSVALQHAVMPFATVLENRLELMSLYSLLFSFLAVYVAESSASGDAPLEWLPVVVVVLVTATSIVLFGVMALVLLLRILPSLQQSALGRWLVTRSQTFDKLATGAQGLRERLLVSEETGTPLRLVAS
jgi:hypothetical protein